jgi:hypothetical protein
MRAVHDFYIALERHRLLASIETHAKAAHNGR